MVLKNVINIILKWPQINKNKVVLVFFPLRKKKLCLLIFLKFINALISSARDGGFYILYIKEYNLPQYAPFWLRQLLDWK